ncbi:response regulator transcription factor [Bacillus sp. REN10]|uniref:response regulator transcription factor n=1 Tax=Bacillus sp. REN10 TaxID=2782541 RepID=UPI00193C625A|nr:response regulator transcription factor [Bacillus sp. REN10]
MYILLAEDDKKLGRLVAHMLSKETHTVDWVMDGEEAIDYASSIDYDLVILDWMMPKLSGIKVCQQLRASDFQGLIIMLTAKDDVHDRVEGLDAGADDYIVKPFEFDELLARVRALGRRSKLAFTDNIIQAGDLTLDQTNHKVCHKGKEVQLTPKEYQLLQLLMTNKEQVLPREMLLDKIWGIDADVSANNLDALVRLVRKKVEEPNGERLIQSIRGIGYRLVKHDV